MVLCPFKNPIENERILSRRCDCPESIIMVEKRIPQIPFEDFKENIRFIQIAKPNWVLQRLHFEHTCLKSNFGHSQLHSEEFLQIRFRHSSHRISEVPTADSHSFSLVLRDSPSGCRERATESAPEQHTKRATQRDLYRGLRRDLQRGRQRELQRPRQVHFSFKQLRGFLGLSLLFV